MHFASPGYCRFRACAIAAFLLLLTLPIPSAATETAALQSAETMPPPVAPADTPDGWISWWGVPSDDALLLGMWSLHTSPHRHERNSTQNLVGVQYQGYFASTFKNSYYRQSYFAGITRTVYNKRLAQDLRFDITYKLGILYGYQDHYPTLGGFAPFAMPTFGLTYKMLGADFQIYPSDHPVFSFNFRINIDKWTKGK